MYSGCKNEIIITQELVTFNNTCSILCTNISDINKSCYVKCADFSTCIIDLMYLMF